MRLRDTGTAIVAIAAIAVAVFAVGGALRWAAAIVALLVAGALSLLVTSRRGLASTSPLVALFGLLIALTALQLVPLPAGLLDIVQPVGQALRSDGATIAGTEPWQAISLDAPGTLAALTFFTTLFGIAVVAVRLSNSERGRMMCLGAVASIAGVTAAIVGIHRLFDASSLYGIYTPAQATPPALGPLLNANHLGGLMALGAVVAVGLLFYSKQSNAARLTWLTTALGCTAVVFATLSRGALLALLAGLAVTLATVVARRLAPAQSPTGKLTRSKFIVTTLPITIVGVCALLVIIYTSAGTAADQLQHTQLSELSEPRSKFAAWGSATHLIAESPWLGIGRGAFETVFTRVHSASALVTFSHLENEYMQAVVEWGIPGAIAIALCLAWLSVVALRRWREGPLVAAAFGGLVAVAVQSTVDFGIELLGVAVPATVVAATIAYTPLRRISRGKSTRVSRIGLIAGLVGAALLLLVPATRSVGEDHRNLGDRPTAEQIHELAERHPLDYYAYALAADSRLRDRDPSAIALLNHALVLHPTHAGLHQLAARMLLSSKYIDQAELEYAAALRHSPDPRPLIHDRPRVPGDGSCRRTPRRLSERRSRDPHARRRRQERRGARVDHSCRVAQPSRAVEPRSDVRARQRREQRRHRRARRAPARQRRADAAKQARPRQALAARKAHEENIKLLDDVEMWHGKVADQVAAWLILCDAYVGVAR